MISDMGDRCGAEIILDVMGVILSHLRSREISQLISTGYGIQLRLFVALNLELRVRHRCTHGKDAVTARPPRPRRSSVSKSSTT